MAVLHGKIVLLLGDDWLQVLATEWSASLRKNSVYYMRRTDEGGQLRTMQAVPVSAEVCETHATAAPQQQFLAVIMPAFARHGPAGINLAK